MDPNRVKRRFYIIGWFTGFVFNLIVMKIVSDRFTIPNFWLSFCMLAFYLTSAGMLVGDILYLIYCHISKRKY